MRVVNGNTMISNWVANPPSITAKNGRRDGHGEERRVERGVAKIERKI